MDFVPRFAGLPPAVQDAVVGAAATRRYDGGQVVYLEGEPASGVFILKVGWVKAVRTSPGGREQTMMYLKPGEIFGDVAVFTGVPYPGTAVALEPVEVLALPKAEILDLVARYPELATAILRHLAEHLLQLLTLVENLSLRSVESRLAHTLMADAAAEDGQLVVPRRAWATFDEMASRLGTVRDVLSRAFHTLEEEGLVRVQRHEIVILDPRGLVSRANR